MTLSANQPYFMPYLPYWQLIDCADLFLVSDDYSFRKGSWIPRNRIRVGGRVQYFRLEVSHQSSHRLIGDTALVPFNPAVKLQVLEMAYHKAPHFADGYALCERVLRYPSSNLCEFLTASIREVCEYMYIGTPVAFTSQVPGNSGFRFDGRIFHFCRHFGADEYVNAIGGMDLYDFESFRRRGLRLGFLGSDIRPLPGVDFNPELSVIDAVMNLSREQLRDVLDRRHIIYG